MTEPVQPHELSGLLDGELEPRRAGEVRRAMDSDPELRAQFESLRRMDQEWQAAGMRASFQPSVSLPTSRGKAVSLALTVAIALALLVTVRCIVELIPSIALTTAAQALAITGIVVAMLTMLKRTHSSPELRA